MLSDFSGESVTEKGERSLCGVERLGAKMIKDAWRDVWRGDDNEKHAARHFINNGLDYWCELLNLDYSYIKKLIKTPPVDEVKGKQPYVYKWRKKSLTAAEWGVEIGIGKHAFRRRFIKYGFCERTFKKLN